MGPDRGTRCHFVWEKLGNWVCTVLILTFCLGAVRGGSCFPGGAGGEWGEGHGVAGGGCEVLPLGCGPARGAGRRGPQEPGQALHPGVGCGAGA